MEVRASFLLIGNLNDHHQEWLGSTTTNHHGVAALDFSTVSGCDELVTGSPRARGLMRYASARAFLFAGEWLMSPNSKGSTFLLSGQLQTNFLNTYTVQSF